MLALVATAAFVGGGVALAKSIGGGPGPDWLVGTARDDTLRGFGGADVMRAKGDKDVANGGLAATSWRAVSAGTACGPDRATTSYAAIWGGTV